MDVVTMEDKGSSGINRASQERNNYVTLPGQQIRHKTCRREYCKAQNITRAKESRDTLTSPNRPDHWFEVQKALSGF